MNADQRRWEAKDADHPRESALIRGHQFRYAGGRQRYLVRERDPADPDNAPPLSEVWSDYLGQSIYADYVVDGSHGGGTGTVTEQARYLAGQWQVDLTPLQDVPPGAAQTAFFHTDHLGTTRLLTGGPGAPGGAGLPIPGTDRLYTAFGALLNGGTGVPDVTTRYSYAGSWGYESLADLGTPNSPLLHVGQRHYDPTIGRFLQRDPIGIAGGLNVYGYVDNSPLSSVDPDGRQLRPSHYDRFHPRPGLWNPRPPAAPLPAKPKASPPPRRGLRRVPSARVYPAPWPKNPIPKSWLDDYWPPLFKPIPQTANVCANWARLYFMYVPPHLERPYYGPYYRLR